MTTDPRLGTDLGSYHVEAVIGRGGMGVVYRATDRSLDRPVALKLIAPAVADDDAFRSRFLRESKMAAAIDHPNIIPIYEAGERDGTYFLAMRYVDGTDLERRLKIGPLEPRAALGILAQIAKALDAAHARGLVHRDVKPANVLLDPSAGGVEGDHAYLTDFGLTKQSGSETGLTRVGGFVGTLEYIAPEQIEGKSADGRADQYALAAIAVACLTGRAPFPRDSDVAMINAHLHDPPPSVALRRPELPAAVDAVIARGMAKAPDGRYPDCRSFAEDLGEALGVSATHPRPIPPAKGSRSRRVPLIVAGLIGLGLIAAIGFAVASGGTTPSSSPSADSTHLQSAASAQPTEDVFPNGAELALLATLPDDLAQTCQRGPYGVVESEGGGGTPKASLRCAQDVTSGANELIVRQFRPLSDLKGGNPGFNTDAGISRVQGNLGGSFPIPPGDCATATRAGGRWVRGGADAGGIVCYRDTGTGDAILIWSYQDEQILARAVNQRGDSAALYEFFRTHAPFIGR